MNETPVRYKKQFGLLRNRAIRAEIASLHAQRDCQRIVHLLACYEFPFDITRSLELALFHTYGSASVSSLLDRTGEFRKHGQKRYDDTRLLIAHFLEEGYDSEHGRRAIERMNVIHGDNRIPNDDFLFVLSTFVSYPIDWVRKYGYRAFTPHEEEAWFHFFGNVGQRMRIKDVPEDWPAFARWVRQYEGKHLVYAESNRRVADATIAIFEGWVPGPLKALVQPAVRALIREDLRNAFGFAPPPRPFALLIAAAMRLRRQFMKCINIERHPKLIANTLNRSYPNNSYTIEAIAPSYMAKQNGAAPMHATDRAERP